MKTCINLEGKLQFEREVLMRLVHNQKYKLVGCIDKYADKISKDYCFEKCPKKRTCDFYTRYGMPEQPNRETTFESVYPFEGGLEEINA